jgi:hypothetical protein
LATVLANDNTLLCTVDITVRCCDLWCELGSDNVVVGGGVESRDFLLLVLLRGGVAAEADFAPPMEREERMDVDII